MKRLSLLCIALAAAVLPLRAQRAGETPEQKAARMAWFDSAKLGIFIHWGIYAVDGVSESWSFYNKYLPYEQYMAQKAGFTAADYQPAEWAKLIKESLDCSLSVLDVLEVCNANTLDVSCACEVGQEL